MLSEFEVGFAEGGVAFGAGFFAEVEGDFVFVHLLVAFGFGLVTFGFLLGALFFGCTEGSAFGKIGEALKVEELGGGIFAGGGEVRDGTENGGVRFGEGFIFGGGEQCEVAPGECFEGVEGELFALGLARIDEIKSATLA